MIAARLTRFDMVRIGYGAATADVQGARYDHGKSLLPNAVGSWRLGIYGSTTWIESTFERTAPSRSGRCGVTHTE